MVIPAAEGGDTDKRNAYVPVFYETRAQSFLRKVHIAQQNVNVVVAAVKGHIYKYLEHWISCSVFRHSQHYELMEAIKSVKRAPS